MPLDHSSTLDPDVTAQDLAASIRWRHRGLVKELQIETHGDSVVLYGRAASYYGKQIAQEEVIRTGGLSVLENRIQVVGSYSA